MYQTTWGKVGEKLLQKVQKKTQKFEKPYPQFLLINQLKPLISLNYTNLSTSPHNPKATTQFSIQEPQKINSKNQK